MLPSISTVWPTRPAPCSTCEDSIWLDSDFTVWLSVLMPVTVLICAIWLVTCALSIGFIGSWFFICVTSSLRKRSDPSSVFVVVLPFNAS